LYKNVTKYFYPSKIKFISNSKNLIFFISLRFSDVPSHYWISCRIIYPTVFKTNQNMRTGIFSHSLMTFCINYSNSYLFQQLDGPVFCFLKIVLILFLIFQLEPSRNGKRLISRVFVQKITLKYFINYQLSKIENIQKLWSDVQTSQFMHIKF
jgi:hypothetical protein